ncbi:MAG TPA: hypothetical protein VJB57_15605 [Dehalococcoidia bacterium]|nr:hypothetical protein [Dehalococcoidia bacterium]
MRGRLRLELKASNGETLAVRESNNAVMQAGARLVAELFAGRGTGITHMGVGTSDRAESESYNTLTLTNDAAAPLQGATEAALPEDAFSAIELDETQRVMRIRVRGTLPPAAAIGFVREAGLIARSGDTSVLYNRVTFAPLEKKDDHELTMFWEVTFPYGDLQWVM